MTIRLTGVAIPVEAVSIAEVLGEEMAARSWTIEDAGGRMAVRGPASDSLELALAMSVQSDRLVIEADVFDGLARAFNVSPDFFRTIHDKWLAHPEARRPYSVPDELFGPWLRAALADAPDRTPTRPDAEARGG